MKARFIYRNLKARFRDQRREIQAILETVRPGDTIVDIGANKGSYLYWMCRAVKHGKVIAFEPQPNLAAYLRQAAIRCGLKNLVIEEKAVSNRTGSMTLYIPGENDSPGASLEPALPLHETCRPVVVPVVTLDEYLSGVPGRVAVIKVDVEGHELAVFRGAERALREHSPLLIFEAETRHVTGHTIHDILNYLRGLGYDGVFVRRHALLPINEFDPMIHQRQEGARFWDDPLYCNNFIMRKA